MGKRSDKVWFWLEFWKLKGARRGGTAKVRCLLWLGEDSKSHLLLKCPETLRWTEKILRNAWPHINEKVAIKKKKKKKNDTQERNLDTVAYNIECKWEKPG
jgi:hypothetical protein